jgi:hypothetical protein
LLDLALETAQRAFQGFSVLDVNFSQTRLTCLCNDSLLVEYQLLYQRVGDFNHDARANQPLYFRQGVSALASGEPDRPLRTY